MAVPAKLKGRYEIRQVLDQGGMGVVYRAYDTVVKREVAVKTLRDAPERAAMQLFFKECDVLAALSHPNIIEIFDIGEFEEEGASKPYFVMPLLPGSTLDVLMRTSSSRLTVERTVDIICQVCRGLHAAHERGLVHRDLKPSNIFVLQDDSVKIIDFGLAHMVDAQSSMAQWGTLLYMAPEQIEMKALSPLTDIFAVGVIAYETFAGRLPWDQGAAAEVAQSILHQIPPPVSDLNPRVNQSVGRVVHKAMAKQPWHRFSTARELAETLQKALRNEPIEMFDPARIQPRIQRAAKAFEQGDYQFASEILSELEAEGHMDPAMSRLRRQLDQAIRRKMVYQLLESARTRLEEEEYPLALQKVQEALELDPDNDDALALKDTIESRRSQMQIDDWLRLARQHLNNYAFGHARQALQNVIQQRAKESRAVELLAEVDRREEAYLREVQEKQQLYQAAEDAYYKGELSSALCRMQRVLDLDRRAPDVSTPERGAVYQNFYNQVRSEHDAIAKAYAEARKRLEEGNFARARELCDECLAKYPGQALFQALKFEVEEQQRQQLSAFIAEADRQVEAEPDLDRRVSILKEAVERYPDETHFARALRLMCDRRDLVNSIVTKARQLEARGQFGEALGQWEILRSIHRQYPGLEFELERVAKRRDQQVREEAKARWVEQIDRHLDSGDHSRALSLLQSALAEFPGDAELAEVEKLIRRASEVRAEAERLLAEGQALCQQQRFEEGVEMVRRAFLMDQRNPAARSVLLDTLIERARALLESDWRAAEGLVQEVLDLEPSHSQAQSLRALIEDRKREEFVDQCVAKARQLQTAGDLEGALAAVEQGMATYPYVMRLTQLRATLERALSDNRRAQARRSESEAGRVLAESAAVARRVEPAQPSSETVFGVPGPGSEAAGAVTEVGGASLAPPSPAPPPAPVVAPPASVQPPKPAPARPALLETLRRIPAAWLVGIAAGLLVIIVIVAGSLVIRSTESPATSGVPVEIGTSPPGATIRVNQQVRGASPVRLSLPPGTYQLEATLEGHEPASSAVTVGREPVAPVRLILQPLAATLRSPTGAESGAGALDRPPSLTSGSQPSVAKPAQPEPPATAAARPPEKEKAPAPPRAKARPAPKPAMAEWENLIGWSADGKWFVRTGGEFQCLRITPTTGVFTFTAMLRKGRRLQWFLRYKDTYNYVLFQIDKNNFYRKQVVKGKTAELAKKPLGIEQAGNLEATSQVEVTPRAIIHKIRKESEWVTVDAWEDPAGDFASGQFGFLINGRDQVALSDFSHQAR
jgi:serine/threonine-protein kinase